MQQRYINGAALELVHLRYPLNFGLSRATACPPSQMTTPTPVTVLPPMQYKMPQPVPADHKGAKAPTL